MRTFTATALFLCLALNAGHALAADGMSKDKDGSTQNAMQHDGMSKDAMSKGAMTKDGMSKHAMSKDGMAGDAMKKDKAPQGSMAGGAKDGMMSDDAMKK